MAFTFTFTISDTDKKIADTYLTSISAWAEHAVRDKIRRLSERILRGELEAENPDWSLHKLVPGNARSSIAQSLNRDLGAVLGSQLSDDVRDAILDAINLPTRQQRDAHHENQQ